ncbi:MAG: hypothetical protein WC247_08675 [Porticoccaceae bacterium]|jgi:hypothetical protein
MTSHRERPEKSTGRNRSLAALLIAALAGGGLVATASDPAEAPARESSPPARQGTPPAAQPGDDKAPAPAATGQRQQPADIFKPSEEISEDLSVPFPVDI